jgi:hypothetical protein
MDELTIKRGDTHQVRLAIGNAPLALTGGVAKVHVKPSLGGIATVFNATLDGNVVVWQLDGSLPVGRFLLEAQVTVSGQVVTAPSNGMMPLVVLADLA